MPNTPEGKARIKSLEKNMADVNRKLADIQSDVSEIKRCLLGDPEYQETGIIGEHKDMYNDYKGARWFLQNIWGVLGAIAAVLVGIIYRLFTEK
jgi:hypothetical protein